MKKIVIVASAMFLLISCSNTKEEPKVESAATDDTAPLVEKEKKEERNKQVIMASMEAMNAHDVDRILKDAAPNTVDLGDGSGKPMQGIDSIKAGMKQYLAAFPDVKGANLKYAADGDIVMVWGEWSGTFKNDFMGMKATNKSFRFQDVDIFKMTEDGKILEHRFVQSPMNMMNQLGVKMPDQK